MCRRTLHISATPSGDNPPLDSYSPKPPSLSGADTLDTKFEVLGSSPYSLLSISLSASQPFFARRGTLVGLGGKAENVISTLSILGPFRRAVLGIPFLYQKISSASPVTALLSTKSPITSLAVVHLNGTLDWMVAQRQALLAWTGHTLSISPVVNAKLSLAHWGYSQVTGRGLLALAGKGQVFQITLKADESYVAHPSNVVAYTVTQHPPLPYRLKSSSFRLQIPNVNISSILPDTKFLRVMRESGTWRIVTTFLFNLRTWSRRTIWGDRLFLQFHGPTTILLQTRASRLSDVLTTRDFNELADSPAGSAQTAVALAVKSLNADQSSQSNSTPSAIDTPTRLSFASIGKDGKVKFEETENFNAP
ncbi:Altered inheritance of mitochondria protein 24, mitochondrial [Toensbergia leucococca]|nr:Altered inheritance of mitochondria protein 24, mitochondrial [Toensbergia leucococca]